MKQITSLKQLEKLSLKELEKLFRKGTAKQMLQELNGKTHLIITAIVAIDCSSGKKRGSV